MTGADTADRGSARDVFRDDLQWALAHLYDPAELRKSPLITRFGLHERHDPLGELRRILSRAILALKPADSIPVHADIWRIYHVLSYRYIEQLSQREVASDMGLSIRHLRRLEHEAVTVLADAILAQYGPSLTGPAAAAGGAEHGQAAEPEGHSPQEPGLDREDELAWLRQSLPSEAIDLSTVVEAALRTVRPLSEGAGVTLEYQASDALPPVAARRGGVRQALLNMLTAAIHSAPAGRVRVMAEADGDEVRIVVLGAGAAGPLPVGAEVLEKLEMTRQLAELSGGRLRVVQGADTPFAATLTLTAAEQIPVLVIDDNADALRLFERYAAGTHYCLTGTRDPEQALSLADELAARAIVLDIMLPGMDGWELLGRLREHPRLSAVPVIVCTILPQEQLALALGADAFLRKPFSREAFLSALDEQTGSPSRESR